MCFSATASFASCVPIAGIGVATLVRARGWREWLLASLPLMFALHQFNEGFVWLALYADPPIGELASWTFAYMLFAQVLLPVFMPLSIWLIEPDRHRRIWLLPFLVVGGGLAIHQLWALATVPTAVYVRDASIVYDNPATNGVLLGVLYVLATCGALLCSGYRMVVLLGFVNVAGLLLVLAFKQYAFISLWCAYAGVVSIMIYAHFHRRRRADRLGGPLRH